MKFCLVLFLVLSTMSSWGKNKPIPSSKNQPAKQSIQEKIKKTISFHIEKHEKDHKKHIKLPKIQEFPITFCGEGPIKNKPNLKDFVKNLFKIVFSRKKPCKEESNSAPISQFSYFPVEPYAGDVITLTSQSTDDKGVSEYEWIVSDGRVIYGKTVGLVFNDPGSYSITHRVRDEAGLEGESSQDIIVLQPNTPPVAIMSASVSGQAPFTIRLDASSSSDSDQIVKYDWYYKEKLLGSTSEPFFEYLVFDEKKL